MMNRLKRVLSLVLVLVMFLSIAVPGYAVGDDELADGWDKEIGEGDVPIIPIAPGDESEEPEDPETPDEPAEPEAEYPAQTLIWENEEDDAELTVTVDAPEGALPAGVEMVCGRVEIEDIQEAVEEVVEDPNILIAVDISFFLGDEPIEPLVPVQVRITAPELEGQGNLILVHVPEEEDPERINPISEENLSFVLGSNEVVFSSDSFSVYAVIGDEDSAYSLTVEFYDSVEDGAEPISTQILVKTQFDEPTEAPLFDPGVPTLDPDKSQTFEGWSFLKDYDESTRAYSVDDLNQYIYTEYPSLTKDVTIKVYAKVFTVIYVTYRDQAGAVLERDSYVKYTGPVKVEVNYAYSPFIGSQRFAGWTADIKYPGDYPTYNSDPRVYPNDPDTKRDFDDSVDLYPYVENGHWLVFNTNIAKNNTANGVNDNTSADYTSPVFYQEGVPAQAPIEPTRTGYDFGGWFTDENMTNEFHFGQTLQEDTTLYAKWTPKQTTYYVIFWQQSANDAAGLDNADKHYDFYKSEERSATTGTSVNIVTATSGTTADNRRGGNSAGSIGEMGFYFSYNGDKTDTASKVVKGDGSTVLNVYYDRKEITYDFYAYLTTGYSSANSGYYSSYYPHWGYVNGQYVRIYTNARTYSDGDYYNDPNWYTNKACTSRYRGTVYHCIWTDTHDTTSYRVHLGSVKGLWYDSIDTFDWSGMDSTISGSDWPLASYYMMWADNETGRYVSRTFQYETGEHTTSTTIEYNLKQYERSSSTRPYTAIGQDVNGQYANDAAHIIDDDTMQSGEILYYNGTEYYGFELVRYNKTTYNYDNATPFTVGSGQATLRYDDIGSNGHAYFFFARNKWDFVFESNNSDVKTESVYYQKDLSSLASYEPTNGPTGYYFVGWYADPGLETPFDFDQTMPNHAIRVYAKWEAKRFRVILDVTGGNSEIDLEDITFPGGAQACSFRVTYGELIRASAIENATMDDYLLLGWYEDPGFTIPFNFSTPITDQLDTMDLDYKDAPENERQGFDPFREEGDQNWSDVGMPEVIGKITIYAKWRENPEGVIGYTVRYNAAYDAKNLGHFADNTTEKDDPSIYSDGANAFGQPASIADDPDEHFLYWEIMIPTSDTDPTLKPSGIRVYPGQTWKVLADYAVERSLTQQSLMDPTFSLNGVGPGSVVKAEQTVYVPVDTIEPGEEYLIGTIKNGTTYLMMSYNPSTRSYYGSRNVSGYNASKVCYAIPAVLDSEGRVTGVDSSSISGATLQHVAWKFNSVASGRYSIQSVYNSDYYLRVETDSSSSSNDLRLYPAPYYAGYCTFWRWDSSSQYLYHQDTSDNYLAKYIAVLSTGGVPSSFDADSDSAYARTIQLYKKTTIQTGHTVTFYGHNGNLITEVNVEDGGDASALAPTPPARTDYTFTNWYTEQTGGEIADLTNITKDMNVYARYVYSPNTCTVTFRYLGSDGKWTTSTFNNVPKGSDVTAPSVPQSVTVGTSTRTFTGWDPAAVDGKIQNVTTNLTVTAIYDSTPSKEYVVTLRAVYGRADAGKVTHICWYSNAKDLYGNPIDKDAVETKSIEQLKTELGLATRDGETGSEEETKEKLFYEGGEADKVYDERDGYNFYYDNIAIVKEKMPIPVPYSIEGYRFLGWGRISDIDSIPAGHQASEYTTDPDQLNGATPDDLFLKYVDDGNGAYHFMAKNASNQWVTVTQVAGSEELPYHDMYAVWEPVGKINWYSNMTDVAQTDLDADCFTKPDAATLDADNGYCVSDKDLDLSGNGTDVNVRANTTYSYTGENGAVYCFLGWSVDPDAEEPEIKWVNDHFETVTTVNIKSTDYTAAKGYSKDYYAIWQAEFYVYHSGIDGTTRGESPLETIPLTRAAANQYDLTQHLTADTLYGGYYLTGGFTVTGETNAYPKYDGTNWTWSTAQTANGMKIKPVAGQTYYVKEVPAAVYLQPYLHYTYYTDGSNFIPNAWLISAVDDGNYNETGFVIVSENKQARVCKSFTVKNRNGATSVKLTPTTVFGASKGLEKGYLTYLSVIDYSNDLHLLQDGNTVAQYWITEDNILVTGITYRTYTNLNDQSTIQQGKSEWTDSSILTDLNRSGD